jgi:hypothetical protein
MDGGKKEGVDWEIWGSALLALVLLVLVVVPELLTPARLAAKAE